MSASSIPLFGRAWNLQVLSSPDSNNQQEVLSVSSNSWEPEALRITFDIYMPVGKALWTADISIYNLNPSTVKLLAEGQEVSLSAGYQNQGTLAEIFRGPIFQPLWEKQNGTETKLTLRCIVGTELYTQSVLSFTHGPYASQWDIVRKMMEQTGTPIAYLAPQTSFVQQATSRSKTVFGNPGTFMDQIAKQNNMVHFMGSAGFFMGHLEPGSDTPDFTFAPALYPGQQPATNEASLTRSLIGTPQATPYGVNFRVLLDSRVKAQLPTMLAKIDLAVVRQLALVPGATPSILDQDGIYAVGCVRHRGDSRGNEWYTEVTGFTSPSRRLQMLGAKGNNSLDG